MNVHYVIVLVYITNVTIRSKVHGEGIDSYSVYLVYEKHYNNWYLVSFIRWINGID